MSHKRLSICLVTVIALAVAGCNSLSGIVSDDPAGADVPPANDAPPPNVAPTAVAGEDRAITVDESILFDATKSFDPDGEIVAYAWDLGDGGSSDLRIVDYVFDEPGEFTVTLTVTDDLGATGVATVTVVVAEDQAATAMLEILVEPDGAGSVTLDPPGSLYTLGTSVTITALPADGFSFEAFIDEAEETLSGEPVYSLTIDDDVVLTARFIPDTPDLFALSIAVSPAETGTVLLEPASGEYEAGTLVTLTAVPSVGYEFVRFSGDTSGTDATADIVMNSDMTIVAEFARKTVTLVVDVDPPGSGSVGLDPPGGIYDFGTNVTITASPVSGFTFDRFVDDQGVTVSTQRSYAFAVEADTLLTAKFVSLPPPPTMFSLSVEVTPPGGGTVSLDPPGGTYESGAVVTLTANPSAGFVFAQYSGDVSGDEQTIGVTMDRNKTVAAAFVWSPALGNPGNLLVTGFVGKNVTEFDRFDGTLLGEIVPAENGELSFAGGIQVGPDGNLYVVNTGIVTNTSILRYDGTTGDFIDTLIDRGDTVGFFTLRFGPNGQLFVPDSNDSSISEYDGATGAFVRVFVEPGAGGLDDPLGLVFGPDGNLFVASKSTDNILEFEGTTGMLIGTFADLGTAGFSVPVDIAFNGTGDLFVTVGGDESVVRVNAATGIISPFVTAGDGGLDSPGGILFHPDTGNLLVVSQGTNSVLEYDGLTGEFLGTFAAGSADESLLFMAFRPR